MTELSPLIEHLDRAHQVATIMRQVVEDGNTTIIGGIHIKNVEVSIFFWIVSTILSAGIIFNWVWTWWLYRGDRSLEEYVISGTDIEEPDDRGYRLMTIRHWGDRRHIEDVFIDPSLRKELISAGMKCDWMHRFVKHPDPEVQADLQKAMRDSLLRHFVEGEKAKSFKRRVQSQPYVLALTGSDTKRRGGVRMFRAVLATERDLFLLLSHPKGKWKFGEGEDAERMEVRLETLYTMAKAHFAFGGYRSGPHGKPIKITTVAIGAEPL